ncbi:MAG: YncE family protein [Terriglobales bacterium]
MTKPVYLALVLTLASVLTSQTVPPLKLIATVSLPELVGDLEFFAVDVSGNRLFLCAEDGKTVEVFNLGTGQRIHTISGFDKPHSIVYLPDSNELVVSDGGASFGWVDRVSATTYKIIDRLRLPNEVDEAMFDPVTKYFYVESGAEQTGGAGHLINIVDTATFKRIGEIAIRGKESSAMAVDHVTQRLYVNNSLSGEISVVDLHTLRVVDTWPLPGTHHLNCLAFDSVNHRLFSASRDPGKFWVINTDTGKIVSTLSCAESNDNLIYDRQRMRIYITGNDFATVIQQHGPDDYQKIADVPTGYRAKTSLLVPELNRLYIALSGKGPGGQLLKPGAQLAVKIYEVQP